MNTWNLKPLFPNREAWQNCVSKLQEQLETLKHLIQSCETEEQLHCCLKLKIEMEQNLEKVYCYPRRLLDLDNSSKEGKELFEVALSCYQESEKRTAEFQKMVLEKAELVTLFLKKNPYYQRYFDLIIRFQSHQITDMDSYTQAKEQLEAVKDEYRTLIRTLDYKKRDGKTVTGKILGKMSSSSEPKERKKSFEITMQAYKELEHDFARLYGEKRNLENTLSRCKNFDSVLEEQLFENGLPKGIVLKLLEVVNQNLDIEHDFIALKKANSKIEEFHIYDMSIKRELDKKISLSEAKKIVLEVVSILGNDYVKKLEEGFSNGSFDLNTSDIKRKDSFSCITYSGLPYTMLQYKESIDSLRVLAHETGHFMHTTYTRENAYEYFEYPIFLAEIASKVHEMLLYHYLLDHSSEEEYHYLLEQMLSSFCTSFFSQTMLTEFELEAQNKKSADEIGNLYLSLTQKYYGSQMIMDELLKVNWIKVPHFFLYPSYYVWQYATGISIASKIAADLIYDRKNMREKYIAFLKVGNSMSIPDSLALLGIDLEDDSYLEDACTFMREKIKVLTR